MDTKAGQEQMMSCFFQSQKYLEGDVQMDKVKIHNQIGRGNSDVYSASIGQTKIAIKQSLIQSDYQYHNFLKQISTLKALSESSDAIIKYEGYFLTMPTQPTYCPKKYGYLLMERAEMNLSELIKSNMSKRSKLSFPQAASIVSTLLTGFSYLQNLNIAHCDIKPENVLITDCQQPVVKICDVGSCKTIDLEGDPEATIKGTLSFLAPELIKIEADKITSINAFRSDVFSFGLVMLYLVTGKKFSSQQRKETSEEVYSEVIGEWTKQASQILNEEYQITEILKKALEIDQYKRPLFKQLKVLYDSLSRKKKILKESKIKKIKRAETEVSHVEVKQEQISEKSRLPKIKVSNSSTLISFHSRRMLTGKISNKSSKPELSKQSSQKSKRSNDKQKSKVSPMQKTTTYSTFSVDKSKISMQSLGKKIIHVTNQNHQMIPYENLFQQESTFVLHCPTVEFECAQNVVIKKDCSFEVFSKLSRVKAAGNLYLQYEGTQVCGNDENTPTIPNFTSVYINLQNSSVQGGYNNLLRSLCPISLKDLHLQLTGSDITYKQVRMELERLRTKSLSKLDLCWDHAFLNAEQFSQITQRISKFQLKKLSLSLGSAFLKPYEKSRWPLPSGCKILYLNFPNNFLCELLSSLSVSLASLGELRQFYIDVQNNCLTDIDVKILIKSLTNLTSLEKAILGFSWNPLSKGCYCFEQLCHLQKVSSLELRISKCGIVMDQFLSIFDCLIKLFNSNLKILKLTFDRKVSKNQLHSALEGRLGADLTHTLRIDIIGYDCSFFMIYVKKKSQPGPKKIRVRIKQNAGKNNVKKASGSKDMESAIMSSNKTIPYTSMNAINLSKRKERKQEQDYYSTVPDAKQTNAEMSPGLYGRTCEALFTTYPTYECYICLGCIESEETAKLEYFCRACIENCEHKGHHIVRTYEKKVCSCPYNHKCQFQRENNDLICAEKVGIEYKRQYQCQKCEVNESVCQGCVLQCEEDHPEWVIKKSSAYFRCFRELASQRLASIKCQRTTK